MRTNTFIKGFILLLILGFAASQPRLISSYITEEQELADAKKGFNASVPQDSEEYRKEIIPKKNGFEDKMKTEISSLSALNTSFTQEDQVKVVYEETTPLKELITKYSAEAGSYVFQMTLVGVYGAVTEEQTYKVTITAPKITYTISYGEHDKTYKENITFDIAGNLAYKDEQCPATYKAEDCKDLMSKIVAYTRVIDGIKKKLESLIKVNLKKNISPFGELNESYETKELVSSFDPEKKIVFNIKPTYNPVYTKGRGTVFYYDGRSRLTTDTTYESVDPVKDRFDNYFNTLGGSQVAISQVAVDRAYKLLVKTGTHDEKSEINSMKIDDIVNIFPDLSLSYVREDEFTLLNHVTKFDSSRGETAGVQPYFEGVLTIELPKYGIEQEKTIQIKYELYLDNIYIEGVDDDNKKSLNIDLININSYIRQVILLNYDSYVYEGPLREWLTSALRQIYEKEPNKMAFAEETKYTTLLKNLAKDSFFYQDNYIFVIEDGVTPIPSSDQVEKEEKVLLKFLDIEN